MSQKATILKKAEFNPKLKLYLNIQGILILMITFIGIPFIPIWLIFAPLLLNKYFERLECELTTRALRFQKGVIVQTERTIPLDKIQDLTFKEGPLLRWLGLSVLKIETAGNSAQGAADLSLIGVIDAHNFRQMVFDQRDKVTDNTTSGTSSSDSGTESMTNILSEIRDTLNRIEKKIN
jgi:putative membrane protein